MQDVTENNSTMLARRAHEDLSLRARGGFMIYLLVWLSLSLPYDIQNTHPAFFMLNTGILLFIMVLRLAHLLVLKKAEPAEVNFARNWLVATTLVGAGHWGLMSAWTLCHPDLDQLGFNLIASAAVLGIAGTTALSIAKELRLFFPILILSPIIAVLFWRGSTDDVVLAVMALIAVGYVTITSKIASEDYWRAITNELKAEDHAVEMEKLSVTDQLTELRNRGYFDKRFAEEWKRGERQRSNLSVVMLDLDKFKVLNDTYGHAFGDEVLRRVSRELEKETYREFDLAARYGGEEFVILLPNTNAESTEMVGERVRASIENMVVSYEGKRVPVTCSIGGATALPDRDTHREDLLKRADAALYGSKGNGRNCYTAAVLPKTKV